MCGIAGFFGNKDISKKIIDRTINLMSNRGPDASNFKKFNSKNNQVLLVHSRLSIIDLDKRSDQPFTDSGLCLIFNGEIYNYIELRNDLIKNGHKFKTNSDTEVILKSYLQYGEDCVKYFEGMWSFAIWDDNLKKLFMSRDRFGEKPLYFYKNNEGIFFSSETKFIKSLCEDTFYPNKEKLNKLFVNGYRTIHQDNSSFIEGIYSVEPSTNLSISSQRELKKYNYWKINSKIDTTLKLEDIINESRSKLIRSMKLRLRSDVPIAFCLSGGIDSSSLASIAVKELNQKITTFSIIDTDERYNEKKNIDIITKDLDCENHSVLLDNKNNLESLTKLINYHDAPISTVSYFVHSFLSDLISKKKHKVAISGSAADEIYTGYYDHYLLHLNDNINHKNYSEILKDWETFVKPILRNPRLKNTKYYSENPDVCELSNFDHGRMVFENLIDKEKNIKKLKNFSKNYMKNKMMNELFHETVPIFLNQDDLNSMNRSIENRSPYLDTDLVNFLYSVPNIFLINEGFNKYILRESMKGILHEDIRQDRQKKGFNASVHSLFNFKDKDFINFIMEDNYVLNLVPKNFLEKILKKDVFDSDENKIIFYALNIKIFTEQQNLN